MKTKNLTSLTSIAPVIGLAGHRPRSIPNPTSVATAGVDFPGLFLGSDDEESNGGLESGLRGNPGIGLNAGKTEGAAAMNGKTEAAAGLFTLAHAHDPVEAVLFSANSNRATGDAYRGSTAAAQRFWRTVSASRRRSHYELAEGTLVAFTD